MSNNKGINRQGGGLTAPALTMKDMDDMQTAMKLGADYVAVSFPKNATDMSMARLLANTAADEAKVPHPYMIAKIERAEAIPALQEILDASDGIMVARGDLAIEVGNAAVPALQKRMIKMARVQQARHHRHADDGVGVPRIPRRQEFAGSRDPRRARGEALEPSAPADHRPATSGLGSADNARVASTRQS